MYLQKSASIQPRTSRFKVCVYVHPTTPLGISTTLVTETSLAASVPRVVHGDRILDLPELREIPGGSVSGERANLKGLVLGCIEAKFCK